MLGTSGHALVVTNMYILYISASFLAHNISNDIVPTGSWAEHQ